MPRFVILFHETPPGYIRQNHYDLLFEAGAVLRAWAVAELPRDRPEQDAEALSDHRLLYLDYEGPISGDRGCVSRVDRGMFEVVEDSPACFAVRLDGETHRGTLKVSGKRAQYLRETHE